MIALQLLGVTVVVGLMVLYEWPRMKRGQKKERAAFVTVTVIGWVLAAMLLIYPNMPGPTQLANALFKPLSEWIKIK